MTTTNPPVDFDLHLRRESAAFRAALADTDPELPVPTCPDWTAADLLWHLTEVQHFWGSIVTARLASPDEVTPPPRPDGHDDLLHGFDEAHELLCDALLGADDDVPVWTWAPDHRHVAFVRRRQAHEALIHRIDAELTAGSVSPVDATLAADGVDEVLTHMLGGLPEWAEVTMTGEVGRLCATDTGHVWTVRLERWRGTSPTTGNRYDDELGLHRVTDDVTPDFEASATAADLDAWLWCRPIGQVERVGDLSAIEELIAAGVQ